MRNHKSDVLNAPWGSLIYPISGWRISLAVLHANKHFVHLSLQLLVLGLCRQDLSQAGCRKRGQVDRAVRVDPAYEDRLCHEDLGCSNLLFTLIDLCLKVRVCPALESATDSESKGNTRAWQEGKELETGSDLQLSGLLS